MPCMDHPDWRKSKFSFSNGNCVEVASGTQVRDTKLGGGSPVLRFTPGAWQAFMTVVKAPQDS